MSIEAPEPSKKPEFIEVPDFVPHNEDVQTPSREVVSLPEGHTSASAMRRAEFAGIASAYGDYLAENHDKVGQPTVGAIEAEPMAEAKKFNIGQSVAFGYIEGEAPYSGTVVDYDYNAAEDLLAVKLDAESAARNEGYGDTLKVPVTEIMQPVEALSEAEHEEIEEDLGETATEASNFDAAVVDKAKSTIDPAYDELFSPGYISPTDVEGAAVRPPLSGDELLQKARELDQRRAAEAQAYKRPEMQ